MPRELDTSRLAAFEPKERAIKPKKEIPATPWPSRETPEGQISIKGSVTIIDRYKALCKDDRRKYIDMLGILMDNFTDNKDKPKS